MKLYSLTVLTLSHNIQTGETYLNTGSIHTLLLFHPPHVSSPHLVFCVASPSVTLGIF